MANNDNFAQDVTENQLNGNGENGGGDGQEHNSAEAPGRDDDRKLFVGGLSWETMDKELRDHFSAYGEIESINVKTDPNTGRSRGFAFIVFKSPDSIDKVMAAGDHMINNKKVDPKKAKARNGKIFVGGLSSEISDDEIKNFFGNFGNIIEVEMPFDKTKNQRKGFCFITFESEQVVNELLKTPKQTIAGKEVWTSRERRLNLTVLGVWEAVEGAAGGGREAVAAAAAGTAARAAPGATRATAVMATDRAATAPDTTATATAATDTTATGATADTITPDTPITTTAVTEGTRAATARARLLAAKRGSKEASNAGAAAVEPTRGTNHTRHTPVPANSHLSPIIRLRGQ